MLTTGIPKPVQDAALRAPCSNISPAGGGVQSAATATRPTQSSRRSARWRRSTRSPDPFNCYAGSGEGGGVDDLAPVENNARAG